MKLQNAEEIIKFIGDSVKTTPVKVFVQGSLEAGQYEGFKVFGSDKFYTILGDWKVVSQYLEDQQSNIEFYEVENDRRNSAIPMIDTKNINARIEPGVTIREHASIGDNAVIMMGAAINIGAVVGANTMIDMNVVLGGRAIVGDRCHIGAGAVIAGVIEPPSASPVVIEDDVVVGANAVVIEGVRVGKGAVVAAGAIVTRDVEPGTVVAGAPARFIKNVDDKTLSKTEIMDQLRKI